MLPLVVVKPQVALQRPLELPRAREIRATEQVCAFATRHPLDAVVGVDGDTTVVAAVASQALGLAHNPRRAVEAGRDKRMQREILRSQGVPVPDFAAHRTSDDVENLASRAA